MQTQDQTNNIFGLILVQISWLYHSPRKHSYIEHLLIRRHMGMYSLVQMQYTTLFQLSDSSNIFECRTIFKLQQNLIKAYLVKMWKNYALSGHH